MGLWRFTKKAIIYSLVFGAGYLYRGCKESAPVAEVMPNTPKKELVYSPLEKEVQPYKPAGIEMKL